MRHSRGAHRSRGLTHGNLPPGLNAFVGRSAEITQLVGALEAARLVP